MYYTVRIELHKASYSNYEALHGYMETVGFSRTITADDGRKFQLPPAEYSYVGAEAKQQVLEAAKRAAAQTGLNFAVVVTAGESVIWEGLPLAAVPNFRG
jgi:hypothetical protein